MRRRGEIKKMKSRHLNPSAIRQEGTAPVNSVCARLLIIAGVIAAMVALNQSALAGTTSLSGSDLATAITSAFSYDGAAPAISSVLYTGADNVGGPFVAQDVSEFIPTSTGCTAPDGTAGNIFNLVRGTRAVIYTQGELDLGGSGAANGTVCASHTTNSFGFSVTFAVLEGTGKFAGASGSITNRGFGHLIAAGVNGGLFISFQGTLSGSVTN